MNKKFCYTCTNETVYSTYNISDDKKYITARLNIIEGQVRGINQMIEDERYCGDVLIQIAAVSKSLQSLGNKILEKHLKTCVADEIKDGNIDIIDDVMLLIKKLK